MKKIVLLFVVIACFAQDGWERMEMFYASDLVVAPSNSDFIYQVQSNLVFRSTDRGETSVDITPWPFHDSLTILMGGTCLTVSYEDENLIYVASIDDSGGFYRSSDAGDTWELRSDFDYSYYQIMTERGNSDIVYMLDGYDLKRTYDGGETFDRVRNSCGLFTVSLSDPNIMYSYYGPIYTTTDFRTDWLYMGATPSMFELKEIHVDPYDPDILYFLSGGELYSSDMGITTQGLDTNKLYFDIAINYYNPVNVVVSYSPYEDDSRWRPETLLVSSTTRFTDLDTIVVVSAPAQFNINNLEISSGYGSSISPEIDYLYAILEDSTGRYHSYRKNVTEYASARHYYHIERGWNLLSWCPRRDAPGAREAVADLFPDAITPAYAWNAELGEYEAIDSLSPTQGFWLLSDSAGVIEQDGLMTMDTVTVTLRRGWNLIGVQAVPLFADSLESLPIVIPPIYKWKDGEYQQASALVPEQAYWVLCSDSMSIGIR